MDSDPFSFIHLIDFQLLISSSAVLLLLIFSAFISGSEVALFSLSQKNIDDLLESDKSKGAQITQLLMQPKKLLATILVANNLINIAIVILFASFSNRLFGTIHSNIIRFLLEVIVVTFLILLFGEVLPKIYANRNNVNFSKKVVKPLLLLDKIFNPITLPMRSITVFIEKKLGNQKTNLSVGHLSQALELTNQGETTQEEQRILEGIVTFGTTEVKQIMSPRIDIFALDIKEHFSEIITKITEKGYSRIPVYNESIDHIEGVLFIKDLIPYIEKSSFNWQKLIRVPFFVPENKKLDDLLKEFQGKKSHLAIVVDEYGGTSGLVSLEDVLEEIVGDISDEFDDEDKSYFKIDDKNYVFEGKTSLKDFYKIIDVNEEEFESKKGEAETLAGFILEISGSFPKKKQKLTYSNCIFSIEDLDKRRLKQIKVTLK